MTDTDDLIKRLRDKVPPSGVLVVDMDTTRDLARLVVEAADALLRVRNEALEEAAKAVEVMGSGWMNDDQESGWRAAEEAAIAAIRSLKDKGE